MQCQGCWHVFTSGYFSTEGCRIVFAKTHQSQEVGNDFERCRMVSSHMIERVLPYTAEGDWLDIGFGNGSLLFTAQEYGFNPVGIDLREKNVADIRNLGIEAACMDFNAWEQPERFSVISMADVLEHMPFPKKALFHARESLRTGGVLYVTMPNIDCIAWRLMDAAQQNPYWGEIEHYHNFGRRRLYSLLEETGFRPIRYSISERYRVGMEVIALRT
jgi:2-polyprenyl-3-methyl-5-hydroxy-6-metoxy-1,4-benzoquinol methylase